MPTRHLSRRQFIGSSSMTLAASTLQTSSDAANGAKPYERAPWFRNAYRRAVIDMHISDWDEKFLSQFDATQYVEMLKLSKAQSVVCYCQSHTGLFNFPTKVGKQHGNLHGRNVLQEMIDGCHRHGIAVQLYVSLIYDRWCGDQHPEWRMRTWEGKIQGEGDRHAVLCPNSPYREYVRRFVEEICRQFDFEGIRFDMTFWPSVCYCTYCRDRFQREVGGELPLVVDWLDSRWVAFQRRREAWLVEFARMATQTVKSLKPQATVEHQASTFPLDWVFGVTAPLALQNDFLQGDFYGDPMEGSFVRKLLENLTPNRPFGYETSFSVSLRNHTAQKKEAVLRSKASAAIADHAAFVFIDAIDPIGTVNPRAHRRMGRVFDELMPYYEHLGGERVFDVAIYFSPESTFDFAANGRHIREHDRTNAHLVASMQAARRLAQHHVPWSVVTKSSLPRLDSIKALVLSNVNMMDEEEVEAIRDWVRAGGTLFASGTTSLVDKSGRLHADFMLADVWGVSLQRVDWKPTKYYVSPTGTGQRLFPDYDRTYPVYCTTPKVEIAALPGVDVLATITLPWQDGNPTHFASIHSDPPWHQTSSPALTRHIFGKGTVFYSVGPLETIDELPHTLPRLLESTAGPFHYHIEAPASVEATLFKQPSRQRFVLTLADFQSQQPNLPIDDIQVRLVLGKPATQIRQLVSSRVIEFNQIGDTTHFTAPRLDTLGMFAIETD